MTEGKRGLPFISRMDSPELGVGDAGAEEDVEGAAEEGGGGEGAVSSFLGAGAEEEESSPSAGTWMLEMSSPSSAKKAIILPIGILFEPSGTCLEVA